MKKLLYLLLVLTSFGMYAQSTAEEYYERGKSKANLEDYNGAIAHYTKAIEINPNDADTYYNRGISKGSIDFFAQNTVTILLIMGLVAIVAFGRRLIFNITREKLLNETEKDNFLQKRFSFLLDAEISKDSKFDAIDINDLMRQMSSNKQKKGLITYVLVEMPHKPSGSWKVSVYVKSGVWPISDKEETYFVYSILDSDLNQLEEFQKSISASVNH